MRVHRLDLLQRRGPGLPVRVLSGPCRQIGVLALGVDIRRVRRMAVHDLPLSDQLVIAPPHTAVDQDRARAWVLDDEAVHRDFVEAADVSEMKAYDLERHGRKGDTAKTAKRTAT